MSRSSVRSSRSRRGRVYADPTIAALRQLDVALSNALIFIYNTLELDSVQETITEAQSHAEEIFRERQESLRFRFGDRWQHYHNHMEQVRTEALAKYTPLERAFASHLQDQSSPINTREHDFLDQRCRALAITLKAPGPPTRSRLKAQQLSRRAEDLQLVRRGIQQLEVEEAGRVERELAGECASLLDWREESIREMTARRERLEAQVRIRWQNTRWAILRGEATDGSPRMAPQPPPELVAAVPARPASEPRPAPPSSPSLVSYHSRVTLLHSMKDIIAASPPKAPRPSDKPAPRAPK